MRAHLLDGRVGRISHLSCTPRPFLHVRPRTVCSAWESEETAAHWQMPEVRQQNTQQQGQGPQHTLQRVLEVVEAGNLDGMLEFCSDEVIDKLLALKKQTK